ncbi:hypothetical protein ACWCPM_18195 [Streptomyces sp. NPDC002309]
MDRRRYRRARPRRHRRLGAGVAGRRHAPPETDGLRRSVPAALDADTGDADRGTVDVGAHAGVLSHLDPPPATGDTQLTAPADGRADDTRAAARGDP